MAYTRLFITLLFLYSHIWAQPVYAQTNLTAENGDCYGAVYIEDSLFGPVFPGRGFGHILEIRENAYDDPMYIEREHHSIWYKFRVPWDGLLQFDLIPTNSEDDLDFMLFRGAIVDVCSDIYFRKHQPIRTNVSRNDPERGSITGMNANSSNNYVESGPSGEPYSSSLKVKKGELFYLLVDQLTAPKGPYYIHFHFGPKPVEELVVEKPKQTVIVRLFDNETRAPAEASLAVEGALLGEVMKLEGASAYRFSMEPGRRITVAAVRKNYLLAEKTIKANNDSLVLIELPLIPIKAGSNFALEDIKFVGNSDNVLRSSYKALKKLEFIMKEHTGLRIEIQGHVNAPGPNASRAAKQLSTDRAKAIFDHLKKTGVAAQRMEYAGYGSQFMVYPDPQDEMQREANRRVAITIIEVGDMADSKPTGIPLSNE